MGSRSAVNRWFASDNRDTSSRARSPEPRPPLDRQADPRGLEAAHPVPPALPASAGRRHRRRRGSRRSAAVAASGALPANRIPLCPQACLASPMSLPGPASYKRGARLHWAGASNRPRTNSSSASRSSGDTSAPSPSSTWIRTSAGASGSSSQARSSPSDSSTIAIYVGAEPNGLHATWLRLSYV
jgi:hypothetical protein